MSVAENWDMLARTLVTGNWQFQVRLILLFGAGTG
jgi:hypothetical protein